MAQKVEKPRIRNSSGQYAARGVITGKLLRKAYASNTLAQPSLTFDRSVDRVIRFESADFTSDKVDTVNAVIRGVSVITGGLIARGHDLEVDGKTLAQMKECADARGKVPVKVDHKSGAAAVCGYLSDFRIEGNKLKADWHLLQSHPQKEQILETAQRMPTGVGLSAAFLGPDKPERSASGRVAARCAELISVDYVALPAANPNGMFSAKVDTPSDAMNPEILAAIKAAVAEAVAPIQSAIEAQGKKLDTLSNPPTLEDLAQMTPEQLADLGLTQEEVQAALEEIAAEQDGDGQGDDPAPVAGADTNAPATATAPAAPASAASAAAPAASGATAAALAALTKQVTELSAKFEAAKTKEEQDKVATLFSEVEKKITELSAENDSLRQAIKAGGKPSSPGVDRNGVTFFSRGKDKGEFEKLVQLGIEEKKLSKAKAFEFARKENPDAYDNYLVRLGVKQAATE